MQNAVQQQYLKVQVETASPGELTLMLYQEMNKSLLIAKRLYAQNQFEEMNESLHKVRTILNELIITLNMKYEIAQNLHQLYDFYIRHIADFMIQRDEKMLDDVIEFAQGMVETWKKALLSLKKGGN
ncbi:MULTISPECIES: flagellar export chaperone FliS [Paenibacillus]|uniref:Flagellar secretion chaperone FliS n=1 Tax=Paenibacillus albilobatus TaxID=2716884 RepID=A0A919XK86_9BACL|nr:MULTISPECIES: flagellar export chaperone FliS [Paenibacillus]GIO33299.1 flagellar protein FliS [Paenibacillus albilobatus]